MGLPGICTGFSIWLKLQMGMGQNETTRNWTAGFSQLLSIYQGKPGYLFLTLQMGTSSPFEAPR